MVFRHYTVLAQVSLSYSVPLGRFPRVTHPCATKDQTEVWAFVRLACVRHAASVRSEPGSNSQVCVTFMRGTIPGTWPKIANRRRMSFKEPIPALVKRIWIRRTCIIQTQTVGFARMWHRHQVTGFRSLELPGPGAVAHMSLHQNQQCQRAVQRNWRTTSVPRFLYRGTSCPSLLTTDTKQPGKPASPHR